MHQVSVATVSLQLIKSQNGSTHLSYLEVPFETDVPEVLKVEVVLVRTVAHHGEEARRVGTLLRKKNTKRSNQP